eukprot:scaffold7917_cov61-Phaeocystis_antarctica.AAC.2
MGSASPEFEPCVSYALLRHERVRGEDADEAGLEGGAVAVPARVVERLVERVHHARDERTDHVERGRAQVEHADNRDRAEDAHDALGHAPPRER